MLIAPGRDARKNSFSGGVLANSAVEFISFFYPFISSFVHDMHFLYS